jgi:nicotinate-nucleotide adenylyltransferase
VRGSGERIGILGGTFDPPHVGHVVAAVAVRHALALDRVLVVPANVPWQKRGVRSVSAADDRLAMTRAAFAGLDRVEVSTIELDRGGDTYTADTLQELQRRCPNDERFLIVGSDVAEHLDTWRHPEIVRGLARLVVYERPGSVGRRPPDGWPYELVDIPLLDVSSTDIRERVERDIPIDGLVPPAVVDIVRTRALYRGVAA